MISEDTVEAEVFFCEEELVAFGAEAFEEVDDEFIIHGVEDGVFEDDTAEVSGAFLGAESA